MEHLRYYKCRTITDNIGYAIALYHHSVHGLLARLRGDGTVLISDFESGDVLGSIQLPRYPGRPS